MYDATSEPNKLSKYNEQKIKKKICSNFAATHFLPLTLGHVSAQQVYTHRHTYDLKQVITRKWRAKHRDAKLFSMSLPHDPKGVQTDRGGNIVDIHVHLLNCSIDDIQLYTFLVTFDRPLWDYGDHISKMCSQNSWNYLWLSRFAVLPLNCAPVAIVNFTTRARFCYIVWIATECMCVCVELLHIFQSLFKTLNYFFSTLQPKLFETTT